MGFVLESGNVGNGLFLIILWMILILLVSKIEGCILVIKHSLLKTRPSLSMIFRAINTTSLSLSVYIYIY